MKKILYILIFLSTTSSIAQQIEKVEPPFWWNGMHRNELQLMLYGKDIARYTPEMEGITINNIRKTENPNYLFVTINTENVPAGKYTLKLLKNGKRAVDSYVYEFRERKEGSALRKGFDSSDLIYLLMPDRFANGDSGNDSHPGTTEAADRSKSGGRHGGDIQGIIDHLDYIEKLGATAIWSTPLLEDNDPEYSYHTYAQSDVYRIDPRYGTNEDYKRLADELHKRDMKLLMDYVTNHWGAEHWMIKDLPTYDWVHLFPEHGRREFPERRSRSGAEGSRRAGYANSNYRMETQYDPNTSDIDKKYCVDGWFVSTMPDLNQSNPLVLNYLIQNAIWWIEYTGLDGFRVDTYSYNDKEGISEWTKAIMDEYPHFNIVGEIWLHNQAQIAYWQKDSEIGALQDFNSHLPSVMDFTLHDALGVVFNEDEATWDKGIVKVYSNFVNDFLYSDINNLLVFAENHDTQRLNHIYEGDIDKYKMAMTLIATVRGIPQIYYGSEIGMAGNKDKGDGDIRKDFPGGWEGDENNAFTASGRTEKQKEYFDFTSKLFSWRKHTPVIHTGKTKHYLPENNVYVYFRYNDNDTVMVLLNNSAEARTVKTDRFAESIGHHTKGKEVLSGKAVDISETINIPSKTAMILKLE
ncbi:glycoside hydrolase family 13 protein [Sinomicrobium weinanense]|uniref:Glycoside hydrolase family 13 protein n=1 Tax=Sinomicrobium weinanense TaxID=2842200 RepID=A0A926JW56_9FLAO|nr:glycoside hydrolase family 13 protein [Sinomicrobium weinanense]MBC9798288.1 glycoside hydrolase family 13 protein [Sinomicrobium weinanense]MBU3125098.1 glycoside hydrolase family 13 protein [Sinomicrobium weinanense]